MRTTARSTFFALSIGLASVIVPDAPQLIASTRAGGEPMSGQHRPLEFTAEAIRAWLVREAEAANDLDFLRDRLVTIDYTEHAPLSLAELEQLRENVKGKPNHPGRRTLERYEECPRTVRLEFRIRGRGEWRIGSTQQDSEEKSYRDTIMTDELAWSLSERALVLIDHSRGWPDRRDLSRRETSLDARLFGLFLPFKAGPDDRLDSESIRVTINGDEETWTAFAASDDNRTFRIMGRWSEEHQRPFFERLRVRWPGLDEDDPGSRTDCGAWRWIPEANRWAATESTRFHPDDTIRHTLRLVSVEREPPGYFEEVSTPPQIDGADPIRGEVTATVVNDYTPEHATFKAIGGDRSVEETTVFDRVEDSGRSTLRITGWFAAGAIAALLIAIRVRRARF